MPYSAVTQPRPVLRRNGGTRTAAITGAYVALHLAFQHMQRIGAVKDLPLTDQVAAISCGLVGGTAVLDLDYDEDSTAEADANFVLTGSGGIVEIQGTAERAPFSPESFNAMLDLARRGTTQLVALQRRTLGIG